MGRVGPYLDTVQADLGMKLDELVSVQLCLFLFNSVFHACVYLFLIIQFFMHARSRKSYVYFRSIRVHGSACRMHPDALLGCRIPVRHWIQTALEHESSPGPHIFRSARKK